VATLAAPLGVDVSVDQVVTDPETIGSLGPLSAARL
jgi:hypothetical protein